MARTTTRTAEIWLEDEGNVSEAGPIVVVRIQPDVYQTLVDAYANMDASANVTGPHRRRLLLDLRAAEPIDAEVRHYYGGEGLAQWFSALAVVVKSTPLGLAMGRLYLRIARPGVPTGLFTDEAAAMSWLRVTAID